MGNGKVSAPSGFDIIEETTDTTAVQPPEGFEIVDEKKSPDGNGQSTSSETSSSKQEATSPTIDKVKSMVAQRTASQQTPGPSDIQPEPKYAINGKPVKKEEITSQLVTNTSDFVKKLLSGETSLSVQDDPALESMLAGMVKQKKQEDDHYIKNAWQRGWASGAQAEQMMAGNNEQTFSAERIAQLQKTMQANRPRQLYEQAGNAKSLKESLKYFAKDPIGITAEAITESTAAQVRNASIVLQRAMEGGIAGGVAGSVVPGIGTVAGFTTGVSTGLVFGIGQASLNQEYAGKIIEGVQSLGYDATKPEDLEKAFSDEASMAEIKRIALLKGVPVGVFDAFSGGIAGRVFKAPAKKLAGKAVQWGTELIVQGALGAGGELAGQAAAGEEIKAGPAMMEFIGEVGFAPVEIASNKIIDGVRKGTVTVNDFVQAHKVEKKLGKPGDIGKQTEMASTLGEIEEESKQFIDEQLANVAQAETMVPKDVPNRDNAVALIAERIGLEKQKERTDPAFHKPLNDRIKEINDELNPVDDSENVDGKNKPDDDGDGGAGSIRTETSSTQFGGKPQQASVPLLITKKMEADLKSRGYTQEEINKLTPEQANEILMPVIIEPEEKDAVPTIGEKTTASESAESGTVMPEGNVSPTSAEEEFPDARKNAQVGKFYTYPGQKEPHELIEIINDKSGKPMSYLIKGEDGKPFKVSDSVFMDFDEAAPKSEQEIEAEKKGKRHELISEYLAAREAGEFTPPKQQLIADRIHKIREEDFKDFGDKNLKTGGVARQWFSKDALPLDVIAQEMSTEGMEITPQDIIDFVMEYTSGLGGKNSVSEKTFYGKWNLNSKKRDIETDYEKLTGKKLDDNELQQYWNEIEAELGEVEIPEGESLVDQVPEEKRASIGEIIAKYTDENGITDWERMDNDINDFPPNENFTNLAQDAAKQLRQQIKERLSQPKPTTAEGKAGNLPAEKVATSDQRKQELERELTEVDASLKKAEQDYKSDKAIRQAEADLQRAKDSIKKNIEGKQTDAFKPTQQMLIDDTDEKSAEVTRRQKIVDDLRKDKEREISKLKEKAANLQQQIDQITPGQIRMDVPEAQSDEAKIEAWLDNSDYSDYISFDWNSEQGILEIFQSRDKAPVELSREELAEEGLELSEKPKEEVKQEETATVKQDKTARDAAKDFISPYVKKGWTIKQLQQGQGGVYGGGVRVQIGGYTDSGKRIGTDKIVVSQVNGKKIEPEIFSLKELYDEIAGQEQKVIDLTGGPMEGKGEVVEPTEVEQAPDERAVTEQDIKDAEKKTQRLIRDEKLKKDIDNLWDDFTSAGGKLTSGIDPERLAIGIKIIGKYTQAGIYKLSDILTDASAKLGEKFADYFDAIKAAYNAYYSEAPDDVAEQMDDSKAVRGIKIEQFQKKEKNYATDKTTDRLKNPLDVKEIRKHWRTVEVDGVMYRPVQKGENGVALKGYDGNWIAVSEKSWEMPPPASNQEGLFGQEPAVKDSWTNVRQRNPEPSAKDEYMVQLADGEKMLGRYIKDGWQVKGLMDRAFGDEDSDNPVIAWQMPENRMLDFVEGVETDLNTGKKKPLATKTQIRPGDYFQHNGERHRAHYIRVDGVDSVEVLLAKEGEPLARHIEVLTPQAFEEKYGLQPIEFNANEYLNSVIEKKAANERYKNGKTIKETIDNYIAQGYDTLKGKKLARDKDDFVTLREGTELDYARIATQKIQSNEPSTTTPLEPDSPRTDATQPMGEEDVQPAGGRSGEGTAQTGKRFEKPADTGQSNSGIPTDTPTSVGVKSHTAVSGQQQLFGFTDDTPGVDNGEQGSQSNEPGYDAEQEREDVIDEFADNSFEAKLKAQKKAEGTPHAPGKENIRKSLPLLLPHQIDNVDKAERRFEKHKGFGIFDGTGTGKTLSGLGIAKRFLQQGKKNILIVVPSETKVTDWITEAEFVNIEARGLKDTKDGKGGGVIVTTYHNFYQNNAIDRQWDLVIYDESHNLNANKAGKTTSREEQHKNVTGIAEYVRSAYYKQVDYYGTIKKLSDNQDFDGVGRFEAKVKAEVARRIEERASTKAVFLSATPFTYHKNLFYADGYLFDTKTEFKGGQRGQPSTGGDPQDQFMVNYLGYQWGNKWRNGVQKPESGVDVGLLERELHEKWNKEGAISAYTLKIPQDYSRNFLLVGATEEAKVGREMDRGAEVIWNAKKPDGTRKYEYLPTILRKKWTYVYKNRILEAIKAREILGEVERLANEGKKVVIFHRYNKGVPSHPFRFNPYEEEEIEDEGQTELESLGTRSDASEESYKEFYDNLPKEARMEIAQFEEENPDLYNLNLTGLVNPIETYMSHFGDKAVLFNGDVPKKIRKQNITKFQDPKSGVNVIVVNLAAGEAGLNLHDKLGTAERYTFQLGLPVRPVQATQSEGRTYREGMKSNAHFLYPVLHFNWEKWAFADINDRNVTVENLAMGEQARNMETTFKEGYANPIDDLSESTGTGGKESDSRMEAASPFEKAKTYYWKRAKKTSATKSEEGVDYFATPEPLGFKMVEWMDPRPNDHDAEPSAGHGAIARFFKPFTTNKFIEPSTKLASELAIAATGDVIQSNFEDHHIINKYDGIAMNPPYGQAGATAIAHTKKAIEHLRIGGRIVDLVPQGAFNEKFDKLLAETDIKGRLKYNDIRVVARIKLPSIVFKRAGTGVNTQIIIMDRLAMDATGKPLQEASSVREIDLSHITDINEFFDEIEHLTIPKRPAALPNNTEYQQNQNAAQPKIIAQAGIASQHYFKHTKNGQDCYVVKLEKRVSDSDYSTFRTMAKQLGGYYSSYTTYTQQELADPSKLTRGGAIPGFIFKDKASADQMYQQLTGVVKDVQEQQKNENVDQAVNEMEHIKGKQYLNVEHAFDDLYAKVSAHKQKAEMAAQFVGVRRNYAEIAPDDVDTKGEYSRAPRPLLESLQRIGVATPSEGQVKIYDTVKGVRKEVSSYKVPTWKIEFDKFIGKAIEILDKLKLDTSGKTFALPFPPQLWNGFLSAVQTGLKGGKVIADALADGINWLSTQGVAPHEAQRYADQFKGDVELRRFTKRLMKDSELSQEVKDNISQDAREYAVKKNVLTITEANAIIERLGIDDAIRFVTNIDNDLPYRHRTAMGVILIKKLNAQIKAATDKQQKADLIGKTLEVAEATAKYGTELGQGVQAFATYSKVSAEGILMTYQKEKAKATKNGINTKPFEDDVDFMEELMDMIEMRDQAPEGFLQDEITVDILSKIANRTQTPFGKWYDVAWGIWYASVLSGWETQATNIAGNVINGTFETFNSGLEQAVMQKNPAAVPKLLTALWDGLAEGALTAEHIMRTGKNTNKDSKIQANDILERTRFKGGNLNPYNYYKFVPRFMSAVDGTAYYGLYNMRFHEEMRRKARHEGLKGDALESRVQQLTVTDTAEFERAKEQAEREIEALSTVTGEDYKDYIIKKRAYEIIDQRRRNKHPEAVYEADRFASHGTYNYRPHGFLGVITDAAAGLGRRVPPFRLLVPFTRIVGNLFNQQIDYTPYGFARAFGANASTFFDKHRGEYNPERSTSPMGHEKFNGIKKISDAMGDTQEAEHFRRALFKAAFGTTAMMGLCALTLMRDDDDEKYYFDISGRGPADAAKRNQLYAQGWKPYSIKVGSTYISYKYTPLAIAFYIVGNMRDATKYLELGEKDIFNRTAFALQQIGPALMDMNFLNSLTQFMEKMTQPGSVEQKVKAATTGLASPVKPLVPVIGTNFFKQGSEIFDPTIYSAETIQEGLIKGVPIVQQIGLDAQINALGQPVEKSGNRFWALENSDPVWKLLAEKESFIPAIGRSTKMNGTPMNYEQYREFVQRSGQELYKQLNDNLAAYSKMDPVDFDNMLDESATKIRNRIKHEMELTEVAGMLKSKGEAEAINAMIAGKYTLKEASDALQKNAITPEAYRGFVKRYRDNKLQEK